MNKPRIYPYSFAYTEVQSDLSMASQISDEERHRMQQFGSRQRQAEFLAGRIAARRAIVQFVQQHSSVCVDTLFDPNALLISQDTSGAPVVVSTEPLPSIVLSISHTRTRAVAMAGHRHLGVDLCDWVDDVPRISRIANKAFPHEIEHSIALQNIYTMASVWALKEAVAKALRIGLLEGQGLQRICVQSLQPLCVVVQGNSQVVQASLSHSEQDTTAFVQVLD